MLKYYEYAIVTAEFPDEIALAVNMGSRRTSSFGIPATESELFNLNE